MTREEAKDVFLNRGFIEVEGCRGRIFHADKWREACVVISEWLEREPNGDCVSKEQALLSLTGENLSSMSAEELIVLFGKRIKALPPVTPTQRWIPCSDGLPNIKNRTESYLVTLKNGDVCDALFTECDGEHWWNYNYDDVVAWQELPKAYKANTENNK